MAERSRASRGGVNRRATIVAQRDGAARTKSADDLQRPVKSRTAPAKPVPKRTRPLTTRSAADPDTQARITHPERIVFPQLGISKIDVARYYTAVAEWIVPELRDRPLSILRCPDGTEKGCFFQKHLTGNIGTHVRGVRIKDSTGEQDYLCIDDVVGLLELVQMNTIEFHPWGVRSATPDRADRIVFDLDPHASVAWPQVIGGAEAVRAHLESLGLTCFLRTSGGKGLHIVLPFKPAVPWKAARPFARTVADALAALHPGRFVSVAGEAKRAGRIFIDWLRNARGATSVASYSLRARSDAGVAMPLAWKQLAKIEGAHAFSMSNALAHIGRRRSDPWHDIDRIDQALPRI
jgi:bifunctional non-homologous end joining protein LigD